jgi:hypothetical protein
LQYAKADVRLQSCSDPASSPTLCPVSAPLATPAPRPVTCECPLVNCLQIWPGGCHCINNAAQDCYDRCGGEPPKFQSCDVQPIYPVPPPVPTCQCESIFCIQSWPESCYCANAAAKSCHAKCGGVEPDLQVSSSLHVLAASVALLTKSQRCPPRNFPTMITEITPNPEPTPTLLPPNTHEVCGGGRANAFQCQEGYTCITDPYTPGCGPACDALGICVEDKMCGGFAGFKCADQTQMCLDDPRDDCDPTQGGADCAGLCITPHRSLSSEF